MIGLSTLKRVFFGSDEPEENWLDLLAEFEEEGLESLKFLANKVEAALYVAKLDGLIIEAVKDFFVYGEAFAILHDPSDVDYFVDQVESLEIEGLDGWVQEDFDTEGNLYFTVAIIDSFRTAQGWVYPSLEFFNSNLILIFLNSNRFKKSLVRLT